MITEGAVRGGRRSSRAGGSQRSPGIRDPKRRGCSRASVMNGGSEGTLVSFRASRSPGDNPGAGSSCANDGRGRMGDRPMAMLTKVCFYCKQEFQAAHALANVCSPGCRKRTSRTSPPEGQPGPPGAASRPDQDAPPLAESDHEPCRIVARCRRCGVAIEDPTDTRRYCSSACRRAMRRKNRKAMIRRAYVEPVSLTVLRRRDGDRCRICGEPVDPTTQPPDPSAATIDHVVALARGGEHSYRNTQLAHLGCNLAKGTG